MRFDENLDFGFSNLKYNSDTFLEEYRKIKKASSKEIKFQKAKLVFGKSPSYNFAKANKSQAVVVKLLSSHEVNMWTKHFQENIQAYLGLLSFALLHFADNTALQIEGLWQPCFK